VRLDVVVLEMEQAIEHKRGTVLFVDDERRVLNSMRAMFRRDYEVLLANSGVEALAMLRDADVDVIVSDQRMPGMTGVEVLKQVKATAPRAMRILLTGYADLQAIEASINEGEVFRYLTKPCPTDVLREAIDLAVDASREEHAQVASHAEHADAPVPATGADAPGNRATAATGAVDDADADEEITLFAAEAPLPAVPVPAAKPDADDPMQLIEIVPSGAKAPVRTARNVTPRAAESAADVRVAREPSKPAPAPKQAAARAPAPPPAATPLRAAAGVVDASSGPTMQRPHARPVSPTQASGAQAPSAARARTATVVVPRRVRRPPVDIRDVDLLVLTTDARTIAAVEAALDGSHRLHTATHLESALVALEKHPIGVVVTDMVVREEQIRHLTTELKRQVPELVTIVASDRSDAQLLIELINFGQIFRFLLKPLHAGQCRLSIESAVSRHRELALSPAQTRRHVVAKPALPRPSDGVMHQVIDRVRRLRDRFFTAEA